MGCKCQISYLLGELDFPSCAHGFVLFFLLSNSHCNFFEWDNEEESKFEGNEAEFQDSGRTRAEEDEVCLEKRKVILELIKKNEKLKTKLQEEKKFGSFLQYFSFYRGHYQLSWFLCCCSSSIVISFLLSTI